MEIMAMVVLSVSNMLCFWLGMRASGKEVGLPRKNPREKKEVQRERERVETILRNIDSFDGTAFGQEDVPGR